MSRSFVPDWIKNLLIVLLSISALWLLTQTPLYEGSPLAAKMQQFFTAQESETETPILLTAAARPTRIAVTGKNGRYGVQYDAETVDTVFDRLGSLLGEALSTDSTPFVITEERWRTALQQPGIYFDFDGAIPFSALSGWLHSGEVNEQLTFEVRQVVLACGNGMNDVWLFWQDVKTGTFYACDTPLDQESSLLPHLTSWLPNDAFFAFEDVAYEICNPYTLITSTPSPTVYEASVPLSAANSSLVEQILSALSYSVSSGSSYTINGGTRYTDGSSTFQLTDGGVLTYHAANPSGHSKEDHEVPTTTQCIETTRQLASDTLGKLCNDARLYLISAVQEENTLTITYGYSLNGASVFLYQDGWAAQFVLTDGEITSFTMNFRSYIATSSTTLILPELQAVAAMSALDVAGSELILVYQDNGESSVTAGWVASERS